MNKSQAAWVLYWAGLGAFGLPALVFFGRLWWYFLKSAWTLTF